MEQIKAPFTKDQVTALNSYQVSDQMPPFTCGGDKDGDRHNEAHKEYAERLSVKSGTLIATEEGWRCPVCTYTQDWAHDFMVKIGTDLLDESLGTDDDGWPYLKGDEEGARLRQDHYWDIPVDLSDEQRELVERAAATLGVSVNEFMVNALTEVMSEIETLDQKED